MHTDPVIKKCENWIDYWSQDDFWRDSPLWEINSRLFFQRVNQVIGFKKNDRVFDIGCGVGYTETVLAPLVESVYAADVAEQFVATCSQKCRDLKNVRVGRITKDRYTDLSAAGGPFTVFLCVSVVQYFKDFDEIEALVASARSMASPGAWMLIADLPLERDLAGILWDAACSFFLSVREGYASVLLWTVFKRWAQKTRYKVFYDAAGELHFTTGKLEALISRSDLNARIIRGPFSVCANRPGLLIQF
jgi:2-polyprenyl-3-methyl-5-hydroxy-6-metoxy-1,4-benzoquinol methylase